MNHCCRGPVSGMLLIFLVIVGVLGCGHVQVISDQPDAEPAKGDRVRIFGPLYQKGNHFYIEDMGTRVVYRLVGVQKDDKVLLHRAAGSRVGAELRVISTRSAKARNAHLIRLL